MTGGKRNAAGRPAGSKARATADEEARLSERARKHADDVLSALAEIAANGQSESARVSAATALLDRGYGRPRQSPERELEREDTFARAVREICKRGSRPPVRQSVDEGSFYRRVSEQTSV